jgi:hypothetical protein
MRAVAAGLCVLALGLAPALAGAAPHLNAVAVAADGSVLIPDTRERGVYYYVPRQVGLLGSPGRKEFRFLKAVRLEGGAEVSSGGFLALTLGTQQPSADEQQTWRQAVPKATAFRPLPVREASCRLVLTRPDEPDAQDEVGRSKTSWSRRTFSIPLSGPSATLLWRELDGEGRSSLAADIELVTHGYELRETPGQPGTWEETTRTDRFTVPIEISRRTHPDRFELVDLDLKTSFRFRALTVYYFDFANGVADDLEELRVEVEVATERGERRSKTVVFGPESEPLRELAFDVPEEVGARYRYRLTRYTTSGAEVAGSWRESDAAILDLSSYELELSLEDRM